MASVYTPARSHIFANTFVSSDDFAAMLRDTPGRPLDWEFLEPVEKNVWLRRAGAHVGVSIVTEEEEHVQLWRDILIDKMATVERSDIELDMNKMEQGSEEWWRDYWQRRRPELLWYISVLKQKVQQAERRLEITRGIVNEFLAKFDPASVAKRSKRRQKKKLLRIDLTEEDE